jgi:hypothetical protein
VPGRSESDQHTREHHGKAENSDDGLTDDNAGNEGSDTRDANENTDDENRVVRFASSRRDGSDEVSIIVIETALHLFQEALLLFGKWHPVPLRLGIDAVRTQLYARPRG